VAQPRTVQYPTLLDHLASRPRAYPPEPVAAEKFQAMVALRIANTRIRNFGGGPRGMTLRSDAAPSTSAST
jgi:hypothetical protein